MTDYSWPVLGLLAVLVLAVLPGRLLWSFLGSLAFFSLLIGVLYAHLRNSPAPKDVVNKFFANFTVGGHRGSPHTFPENSMSGFEQALRERVDLIEFDVALTSDGVAVLLHDDDLDRTTQLKGPIRDKSWNQLKDVADVGAHFRRDDTVPHGLGRLQKGEPIPTLGEVVEWSVRNNVKMLFDVKDYDTALVNIIVSLFDQYSLHDRAIVCSFFPWVIWRVKRADARIPTGLTWRKKFFSFKDLEHREPRFLESPVKQWLAERVDELHVLSLLTWLPGWLGADMLLTNVNDISRALVLDELKSGRRVCAWTVNNADEAKWMARSLGIPLLTDRPFEIVPAAKRNL